MDSGNAWHLLTDVRFCQEEEAKEERDLLFLMKYEENKNIKIYL
jgi:hypothetical protein